MYGAPRTQRPYTGATQRKVYGTLMEFGSSNNTISLPFQAICRSTTLEVTAKEVLLELLDSHRLWRIGFWGDVGPTTVRIHVPAAVRGHCCSVTGLMIHLALRSMSVASNRRVFCD